MENYSTKATENLKNDLCKSKYMGCFGSCFDTSDNKALIIKAQKCVPLTPTCFIPIRKNIEACSKTCTGKTEFSCLK